MRQTLTVLVENRTGVLARVAGLFSRRGYNIESLSVNTTENKNLSRMTIVVEGDEKIIEQVVKQLHKLIEVIKISNITGEESVSRGMALFKVHALPENRSELIQLVNVFRGHIPDFSSDSLIIELTGSEKKITAFEEALQDFELLEVVRTGQIAMLRGNGRIKKKVVAGLRGEQDD